MTDCVLHNFSQEILAIQNDLKHDHELEKTEVKDILLDFHKLDFARNLSSDPTDVINYNDGKEANPFDKISKYYGKNKNIFRFISVLRDMEQSEKIINMSKSWDDYKSEKFIERMKIYLNRITQGERDAKEFLNCDLVAFFNGYYVACPEHDRNIHANLNINITQAGQMLETSCFFGKTIESFEEKSEVQRAKIYCSGRRILNITKNEKQQRNYSFTKHATCNINISWNSKDQAGKDKFCAVVLNLSSGQMSIGKLTVNNEIVEINEILELAKQNDAVLIKNQSLYGALKKSLKIGYEGNNAESNE